MLLAGRHERPAASSSLQSCLRGLSGPPTNSDKPKWWPQNGCVFFYFYRQEITQHKQTVKKVSISG